MGNLSKITRNYSLATPRINLQALQAIKPQNIEKTTDKTIPREENKPESQTNTEDNLDDFTIGRILLY